MHQLRATLERAFGTDVAQVTRVTVLSFGYKYGLPMDADLVIDVRFLPNPFWIPELREHTGRDAGRARLRAHARRAPRSSSTRYLELLRLVGAGYRREGKRYLTVVGRLHRRQAPQRGDQRGAGPPARRRGPEHIAVSVAHRDLGRE